MAVHRGKLKPPGKTMTLIVSVAIRSLPWLVGRRQDQRGARLRRHPGGRYPETGLPRLLKINRRPEPPDKRSPRQHSRQLQGSACCAFRATPNMNRTRPPAMPRAPDQRSSQEQEKVLPRARCVRRTAVPTRPYPLGPATTRQPETSRARCRSRRQTRPSHRAAESSASSNSF